jgi:PIN domain nuclease of toxin-antitoxin system
MRLLIDTCTLIWWADDPNRLPNWVGDAIENPANDVAVSIVSLWEIGLKFAVGKLPLKSDVLGLIARTQADGITVASIPLIAPFVVSQLPFHHNDPFDRMLVATAQLENFVVVTPDTVFGKYGVETLW